MTSNGGASLSSEWNSLTEISTKRKCHFGRTICDPDAVKRSDTLRSILIILLTILILIFAPTDSQTVYARALSRTRFTFCAEQNGFASPCTGLGELSRTRKHIVTSTSRGTPQFAELFAY